MDMVESKPNRRRRRRLLTARSTAGLDWCRDALLGVVVVGSVLAIGTVHIPVLLVVSALALIGATWEAVSMRRVPRPALVLSGFGLFSIVQAIPLPAAWVRHASPTAAEIWLRCLAPFGEQPLRWFPLSLDGGASIAEAMKWLTYACVYTMAARMRARRRSAWLVVLLFGSASLVTLITLIHGVADISVLYGAYHPHFAVGRWNVGPLLNSNNLGGYALLGLFSGLGLWLSDRSPLPRFPVTIGLGIISVALGLSGSRAALVSALVAGAATVAWLAKGRRQGSRFSPSVLALGLIVFLVAIGLGPLLALGATGDANQLASLDMRRKASVWLWSLPMIRQSWLFGVGRGAFETALPPYRQALEYDWSIVVTHAENFVVQWVAEWGIPVGLFAVVIIVGYVLREWRESRSDPLPFMVMTGLVALFVQNLADLGFEIPSLSIAAVLALAAGERPTSATTSHRPFGRLALAASVPAFAVWAAVTAWSRFPVELERRELSAAYRELRTKGEPERARFLSQLHQAVLRHPGEPFFPLLGSLVALQTSDDDALRWIARSLELGPTNGPAHLVLAGLLHRHGAATQAMLHLKLAAEYDRTLIGSASEHAASWATTLDLLMQSIPEGSLGEGMLLDTCTKLQRLPVRLECYRRAVSRDPESIPAAELLTESLLFAIQAGQAPCDPTVAEQCIVEAEQAAQATAKLEPNAWRPSYFRSELLVARGDFLSAARLLTRICPESGQGDACWDAAVSAALKSRSDSAISSAVNGRAARPCDGREACADMFTELANRLQSGAQPLLANTFFTKAAEADPSAARWIKVAEHATRAQLYGVARAALARADRSPDSSVATHAEAERIRQQVAAATGAPL